MYFEVCKCVTMQVYYYYYQLNCNFVHVLSFIILSLYQSIFYPNLFICLGFNADNALRYVAAVTPTLVFSTCLVNGFLIDSK